MNDKATIGHNSDSAEEKGIFFNHLNTIVAAKERLDEVAGDYKKLRKVAKADGIKLEDMDFAMKALNMYDDSIIADNLRRQMNIARWLDLPIGHQTNFADVDRRDGQEKAFNEGEVAGLRNLDSSDHDYKGDLEQEWLKGWHKGRERLQAVSKAEEAEGAELLKNVGNGSDADDDNPFEDDETGEKGDPSAIAAE